MPYGGEEKSHTRLVKLLNLLQLKSQNSPEASFTKATRHFSAFGYVDEVGNVTEEMALPSFHHLLPSHRANDRQVQSSSQFPTFLHPLH